MNFDIVTYYYIRLCNMASLNILDFNNGPVTLTTEVCPYNFSVCIKTGILKIYYIIN